MAFRVLLIDNYDSYTYSLHHLIATACGTETVTPSRGVRQPPSYGASSADAASGEGRFGGSQLQRAVTISASAIAS